MITSYIKTYIIYRKSNTYGKINSIVWWKMKELDIYVKELDVQNKQK